MNKFGFIFAFVFVWMPYAVHSEEVCANTQNGWRTICLREQGQMADEIATRTYSDLQTKISQLSQNIHNASYIAQLKSLLRKNELDFINYSESFCNMQVVLSDVATEIDKILYCGISTAKLRTQELRGIIEKVDQKERSSK